MSFGNEMVHGGEEEAKGSMEDFTTQVGVIPILRIQKGTKVHPMRFSSFPTSSAEMGFFIDSKIYIYM